jgi:zinc and cadmium transporter
MVSLSVGIMLSTSLLHALPEAFESQAEPHTLFAVLLGGLLAFFLLEKTAILRHSHHHEEDGHGHHHGHDKKEAGKAGWMILVGDGLHNFTDGILIAAAFLADPHLGLVTGLAIIAHEIPQEIGDFIVLLNAGFSRTRAYVYNLICSLMAVAGGLLGYFMLERGMEWIPFVLVFASSGFIYIAVSDLMPQMQRRATLRETIPQVILIAAGRADRAGTDAARARSLSTSGGWPWWNWPSPCSPRLRSTQRRPMLQTSPSRPKNNSRSWSMIHPSMAVVAAGAAAGGSPGCSGFNVGGGARSANIKSAGVPSQFDMADRRGRREQMISIRQLRYFVEIVEARGYTRASERLFIAQSALSRQIKELEADLDVVLLKREAKAFELTQAGQDFYERSRRILLDLTAPWPRPAPSARASTALRLLHSSSVPLTAPLGRRSMMR